MARVGLFCFCSRKWALSHTGWQVEQVKECPQFGTWFQKLGQQADEKKK
jgi:hypothetical protein